MGFEAPLDDIDPSKIGEGFDQVKPGKYHIQINDVKFENKEKDDEKYVNMIVEYEILHGTEESEIGKTMKDFFKMAGKALTRAYQLAYATKVTNEEELTALKKRGKGFSGWEDMIGRQCCIHAEKDTYQGKERSKVGWGIWAIGSKGAEGIPLNNGMLQQAAAGGGSVDPFGGDVSGAAGGASGGGNGGNDGGANADPFAGVNFG